MYSAHSRKNVALLVLLCICGLFLILLPLTAYAQDFEPLEPLPGIDYSTNNPGDFFNSLFRLGVVVAAFLAVIMLVYGGIKYMTTDAGGSKSEAKIIIGSALGGLALILSSYLIISVINPNIANFDFLRSTPEPRNQQNDAGSGARSAPPSQGFYFTYQVADGAERASPAYNTLEECRSARENLIVTQFDTKTECRKAR